MPKVSDATAAKLGSRLLFYFFSSFFDLVAMADNGEVIRGAGETGDRPGRPRGWLAGFLGGVGVGGAVAMVLVALSRSPGRTELVGRYGADGTWGSIHKSDGEINFHPLLNYSKEPFKVVVFHLNSSKWSITRF
jgi:hypothetical protein